MMDGKLALHRTHQAPFIKPFGKGVNMQGLFLKNQFPSETPENSGSSVRLSAKSEALAPGKRFEKSNFYPILREAACAAQLAGRFGLYREKPRPSLPLCGELP